MTGSDPAAPDAAAPDAAAPDAAAPETVAPAVATEAAAAEAGAFGGLGRPLRRSSFLVGLGLGLGLLAAYSLWQAIAALDTVLTLVIVSFVLCLALNPIVEWLLGKGLSRTRATAVVFGMVVLVFVVIGLIVVPPVVTQAAELSRNWPRYVERLLAIPWIADLESSQHVVDRAVGELERRMSDGGFVGDLFGGVLGAGKALLTGALSAVTVLVLTLYFLVALPRVKQAAYATVPASRRERVTELAEEIMRRVGNYAIGQLLVATINACCAYVVMKIVGLPYAAVLAVVVGFLGLIPLVGATAGAVIVALVALLSNPTSALVMLGYFLVYQQVENYFIAPKVMQRTVSVPAGVTIIAALAGGTLAGVLGALLAIPTAAGLLLIHQEVLVPRQSAR